MKQLKPSSHASYQKSSHHSPCCFARPVPMNAENAEAMGVPPVLEKQYMSTVIAAAAVAETSSSATNRVPPRDFWAFFASSMGTRRSSEDNSCLSLLFISSVLHDCIAMVAYWVLFDLGAAKKGDTVPSVVGWYSIGRQKKREWGQLLDWFRAVLRRVFLMLLRPCLS